MWPEMLEALQGKGVGEWLRSRHVDIPVDLLPSPAPTPDKDPA